MNSAPQIQTVEISDADLDTVSGGVAPQLTVSAGATTISSDDVLAQLDSVKATVLGAVGGTLGALPNQASVTVGF